MKKERKERAAVDWSPAYHVMIKEDMYDTHRYDEDGEPIIRSTFRLVAENVGSNDHPRGARWSSPHVHREYASAKSERRHLARDFDPIKAEWYEVDPCYGSEAWTPAVEARIAWQEREEEGWNGGPKW